jgi:hypothetical protein
MKMVRAAGVALCGALMFASVPSAQRPTRSAEGAPVDDKVGVNVALQVDGGAYQFSGRGSCGHEPKGWIYGTAAKLWTVEQSEGPRSITLTLWSPTSGSGNMFTLRVTSGGKSYQADTVKGKDARPTKGAGSIAFAAAGVGGVFTVNATAANGAKMSGTIKCDAFRAVMAEGGN